MKVCLRCKNIFEDDEAEEGYHLVTARHKDFEIHSKCGPAVDMMIMTAVATSLMDIIRESIQC